MKRLSVLVFFGVALLPSLIPLAAQTDEASIQAMVEADPAFREVMRRQQYETTYWTDPAWGCLESFERSAPWHLSATSAPDQASIEAETRVFEGGPDPAKKALATGTLKGPAKLCALGLRYRINAPPSETIQIAPQAPLSFASRALNLWVQGDWHGEYLRPVILDGKGKRLDIAPAVIDFTGWKFLEFILPTGSAGPFSFAGFEVAPDPFNSGTGDCFIYLALVGAGKGDAQ